MANKTTATAETECWREHTCVGCGSTFRYRMKRKQTGTGATPLEAQVAARLAAEASVQNDTDMQPCPSCGLYQPEMIGDTQALGHGCLSFLLVAVLVIVAIAFGSETVSRQLVTWILLGLAALMAFGHFKLGTMNPNANLASNQEKARAEVEAQTLELGKPGPSPAREGPRVGRPGFGHWFAFLLLALGLGCLAAPEVARLAASWPMNHDFDPPVVGPGDTPTLYFPDVLPCLKGYWNGRATVEVLNAREVGLTKAQLTASSQDATWGRVILGKGVRTKKTQPWVVVQIPEEDSLAGKTLQLQARLDVKYPTREGLLGFHDVEQTLWHTAEVRLAGQPEAGLLYLLAWWGSEVIGAGLLLLAGVLLYWLAQRRKRNALPSRVIPIQHQADASPSPAV